MTCHIKRLGAFTAKSNRQTHRVGASKLLHAGGAAVSGDDGGQGALGLLAKRLDLVVDDARLSDAVLVLDGFEAHT
jgi:hypothetical protein